MGKTRLGGGSNARGKAECVDDDMKEESLRGIGDSKENRGMV